MLASLVTAPIAELEARAACWPAWPTTASSPACTWRARSCPQPGAAPRIRGTCSRPTWRVFERLHAAARGHLRVITVAPELPGALAVIKAATRAGVTVAIGHTDATADVTTAAIDAGASHATHLFNGMRPPHHREPGAAGALLDRDEVTCEVIADGVHLHDIAIRLTARAAGPGRLVLVTDAMAAAGMPDGSYRLGSMRVSVAGGVARLPDEPQPRSPAPPPPWPTWSATRSPRACRSPTWPPRRAPPRPACSAWPTAPVPCARAWPRTWSSATTTSASARSCATASG